MRFSPGTVAVLGALLSGPHDFTSLRREIRGLSLGLVISHRASIHTTLLRLHRLGLVSKKHGDARKAYAHERYTYAITPKGRRAVADFVYVYAALGRLLRQPGGAAAAFAACPGHRSSTTMKTS